MIIPAIYAMAGAVWPNGGRQTFNAIYLAQNIGVAVGAAMGGFVAEFSFNYIFLANLIMYVVFASCRGNAILILKLMRKLNIQLI